MKENLVLYTNPMSRGRIIRWMLEEIGQPYKTEVLDYATTMRAPEYLSVNPMGKVPALRHGDFVVTETAAICAYLADAFPAAGLAPALDSPLRAPYYRWIFFAAGPLEYAITNKNLGVKITTEQQGFVGYGTYELTLDTLEKAVSQGDFLVGNKFSAADLYLGSHIGYGLAFHTLEKRPAFERYWKRLETRPARVKAMEIDDALLAATKAKA